MNNFEKQYENLNDEQKLLKRSEALIAHIWNIVINNGKFNDEDLKSMEDLGVDIRNYFHN